LKKLLCLLVTSGLFLLASCSGEVVDSQVMKEVGLSEKQILRIAETNEMTNLDPAKAVDNGSFTLLNNVHEGLMRIKDKQPVKGIAEKIDVSEDQLVYTFHLRKDARWSDGKPITAQDFAYGWKRVLDPETKSEYAFILFPIAGAEEYHEEKASDRDVGIRVLSDHLLEVTLKEPMLDFLGLTALPAFLPQREDTMTHQIYSGPFVVEELTPSRVRLKKNREYWDRNNVSLQQVEFRIVKDIGSAVKLYESGEVDIAPINREYMNLFASSKELHTVERGTTYYLVFNQKNDILQNRNIRKAISLSLDRLQITNQILRDGSKPAYALVHPAIMAIGNKSFREVVKHRLVSDRSKQAELYFKEGLAELGLERLPKRLHLLSYDDEKKEVAVAIKKQLQEVLGIKVLIDSVPNQTKLKRQEKGEYDIAVSSWGADYNDPIAYLELWHSKGKLNIAQFKSKRFDRMLESIHKERNMEKKIERLKWAEEYLVQDQAVVAPIFYRVSSFLKKDYVEDFYNHAIGADYSLKWVYLKKNK
jgi:oligopeptide transport system substrate-binding protein